MVVEKLQPTTTRGIRNIDRPGRPHPFGVQWREFDKDKNQMRRKTEFFEKELERDKKVRELAAMKREGYTVFRDKVRKRQVLGYLKSSGGLAQSLFLLRWGTVGVLG